MQVGGCALVHGGVLRLHAPDAEHIVADGVALLLFGGQGLRHQGRPVPPPAVRRRRLPVSDAQPAQVAVQVYVLIAQRDGEEGDSCLGR